MTRLLSATLCYPKLISTLQAILSYICRLTLSCMRYMGLKPDLFLSCFLFFPTYNLRKNLSVSGTVSDPVLGYHCAETDYYTCIGLSIIIIFLHVSYYMDHVLNPCMFIITVLQQGTSGPSRKPLKCRVMHHKVVAHQICAGQMLGWLNKITNYSGLYLTLCNVSFNKVLIHVDSILLCLYNYRSQMTSKCGKNKTVGSKPLVSWSLKLLPSRYKTVRPEKQG